MPIEFDSSFDRSFAIGIPGIGPIVLDARYAPRIDLPARYAPK